MAMVGVGGSIGTGLLLGSGAAIQIAGPAVIFSFLVAALISWTVTVAFGEMASLHPAAGSFGVYAELYLNSWAGFISRYGDLESDRGAFLDQFFKTGTLDGNRLAFTTEPLHGVWYEFQGTAARGDGKTPNDEGYYVLKGSLTQYLSDAAQKTSARTRAVVFKSFPRT